jgi:hypothetical protein
MSPSSPAILPWHCSPSPRRPLRTRRTAPARAAYSRTGATICGVQLGGESRDRCARSSRPVLSSASHNHAVRARISWRCSRSSDQTAIAFMGGQQKIGFCRVEAKRAGADPRQQDVSVRIDFAICAAAIQGAHLPSPERNYRPRGGRCYDWAGAHRLMTMKGIVPPLDPKVSKVADKR